MSNFGRNFYIMKNLFSFKKYNEIISYYKLRYMFYRILKINIHTCKSKTRRLTSRNYSIFRNLCTYYIRICIKSIYQIAQVLTTTRSFGIFLIRLFLTDRRRLTRGLYHDTEIHTMYWYKIKIIFLSTMYIFFLALFIHVDKYKITYT